MCVAEGDMNVAQHKCLGYVSVGGQLYVLWFAEDLNQN